MKTLNEVIEWLHLEHDYNASPNDGEYLNSASIYLTELKVNRENEARPVTPLLLEQIEHNRWTLAFNDRIQMWTVQEQHQVCGNIGQDRDMVSAIIKAIKQHKRDMDAIPNDEPL